MRTKFIAGLEIFGGGHGVLLILEDASLLPQFSISTVLLHLIFLSLYIGCISAGVQLWKETPRGIRWSLGLFTLQLVTFSSPLLVYRFISGAHLVILIAFDLISENGSFNFGFNFNLGSSFLLVGLQDKAPWGLGINLVAGLALMHLWSLTLPGPTQLLNKEEVLPDNKPESQGN